MTRSAARRISRGVPAPHPAPRRAVSRGAYEMQMAVRQGLRRLVMKFGTDEARALYQWYAILNRTFFADELGDPPLILLTPPASPRADGDYSAKDPHGLVSVIRIAPHVARGELHFAVRTLLHEMVHTWCADISDDTEPGYSSHGPVFCAKANEIGATMDFAPVSPKGRGGMAPCEHWPEPLGAVPVAMLPASRKRKR